MGKGLGKLHKFCINLSLYVIEVTFELIAFATWTIAEFEGDTHLLFLSKKTLSKFTVRKHLYVAESC